MKQLFLVLMIVFIIGIFTNIISAQESATTNVCCERTESGAWCQNTQASACDNNYRMTPTSCDATSFCKLGCCVDSDEGLCMKNTPQKVCELSSGSWLSDETCNVQQCSLGCCVLGDQASFVTLTRCKRLSRIYGLETNFKQDITDEVQCILIAHASDKGACVFTSGGERSCSFTTRQACTTSVRTENSTGKTEFFKDYLCTADELATNCGPSSETLCVDGSDEVYFKDTCGNQANIYDAQRIYSRDAAYWQRIVAKSASCNSNNPNTNSRTCGNCDYLRGSVCGKGNAQYGSLVCKDLNCYNTQNGENHKNGESWCESLGASGDGLDPVGNRYFRHICIQGEETIEPCADFRNEICVQQTHEAYNNFIEAACIVNRWTDCIDQTREKDCLNTDKRDCLWASGVHFEKNSASSTTISDTSANQNKGIVQGGNICLPRYPPGLEFWKKGNAQSLCALGNSQQIVKFEKNIFGKEVCKENCAVLQPGWIDSMNRVCLNLGDCGAYINIAGEFTDFGIAWRQHGQTKSIQNALLDDIAKGAQVAQTTGEKVFKK